MRIAQSQLHASSVAEFVERHYLLGTVHDCSLHMSGVNDVYRVRATPGEFFVKIYRFGWRTLDNVRFEADLLRFLSGNGARLALPLHDRRGDAVCSLTLPEGERAVVVFPNAPGNPPAWPFYQSADDAFRLGAALAALHRAGDGFVSSFARETIDADALTDRPLAAILAFAAPGDAPRFSSAIRALRAELENAIAQGLTRTICHGDFHCGNAFIDPDAPTPAESVTTIDFDACGFGWVAFDLARWRALTDSDTRQMSWEGFVRGYTSVAPLADIDLSSMPLFVKLRQLHWAKIKLDFVAAGQWDRWDAGFFLNELLAQLSR